MAPDSVPRVVAGSAADDAYHESRLVSSLRDGDEQAFEVLVGRHASGMLRVARTYVASEAAAEDVVQDTWVAVMRGLDQFEGRCSLKTWLYRILINRAKSSGIGARQTVQMGALAELADEGSTVAPERFRSETDPRWLGEWSTPPRSWQRDPQTQVIGAELLQHLLAAIDVLPALQRRVVMLRDVEGMSADETVRLLGLSAGNQRTLLHRGRANLRRSLEDYLEKEVTE